MDEQKEYVLSAEEREVLEEIEAEVVKLQQQAQGALRAIMRIRGLTGAGWLLKDIKDGKLTRG